jgi:hypothetical protein
MLGQQFVVYRCADKQSQLAINACVSFTLYYNLNYLTLYTGVCLWDHTPHVDRTDVLHSSSWVSIIWLQVRTHRFAPVPVNDVGWLGETLTGVKTI